MKLSHFIGSSYRKPTKLDLHRVCSFHILLAQIRFYLPIAIFGGINIHACELSTDSGLLAVKVIMIRE